MLRQYFQLDKQVGQLLKFDDSDYKNNCIIVLTDGCQICIIVVKSEGRKRKPTLETESEGFASLLVVNTARLMEMIAPRWESRERKKERSAAMTFTLFLPSSSEVEHLTVNQNVAGSTPA